MWSTDTITITCASSASLTTENRASNCCQVLMHAVKCWCMRMPLLAVLGLPQQTRLSIHCRLCCWSGSKLQHVPHNCLRNSIYFIFYPAIRSIGGIFCLLFVCFSFFLSVRLRISQPGLYRSATRPHLRQVFPILAGIAPGMAKSWASTWEGDGFSEL